MCGACRNHVKCSALPVGTQGNSSPATFLSSNCPCYDELLAKHLESLTFNLMIASKPLSNQLDETNLFPIVRLTIIVSDWTFGYEVINIKVSVIST